MAAQLELSLHAQGWPGAASTGSIVMTNLPLGLDLAKLKLDACLVREGGKLRHKVFANKPSGFAQLSE
jgi:hypothetical protein